MFHKTGWAVMVAWLLVACARTTDAPAPAPDAGIVLHFDAVEGLNPGADGEPAPVRVRLFELKNSAAFLRADYFALAERAQATLGADLIDQDEVLVKPGQQRVLEREPDATTRHLGVVVGFREIDQARWRAVLSLGPRQPREFQISLDARAVHSGPALIPTRPAQ